MSSGAEKLREWRERAFRDPDGYAAIDWHDPVEREAAALYAVSYNTPDAVQSMVGSEAGREELGTTWGKMLANDRQRWRRRAEMALLIGAKDPLG